MQGWPLKIFMCFRDSFHKELQDNREANWYSAWNKPLGTITEEIEDIVPGGWGRSKVCSTLFYCFTINPQYPSNKGLMDHTVTFHQVTPEPAEVDDAPALNVLMQVEDIMGSPSPNPEVLVIVVDIKPLCTLDLDHVRIAAEQQIVRHYRALPANHIN